MPTIMDFSRVLFQIKKFAIESIAVNRQLVSFGDQGPQMYAGGVVSIFDKNMIAGCALLAAPDRQQTALARPITNPPTTAVRPMNKAGSNLER